MAFNVTSGYTWQTETVTPTKLTKTGAGTITDGQSYTFGNGAAGTPSVCFAASATTGLFSPNADQVAMAIAGQIRALFKSTGLIISGVNGPAAPAQLHGTNVGLSIYDLADTQQIIGQAGTYGLAFTWRYGADLVSASAEIGTLGANNPINFVAQFYTFSVRAYASVVTILPTGRVRVGGGTDEGVCALQVNGDLAVDGTLSNSATGGGNVVPPNCVKFLRLRSGLVEYKIPLFAV